MINYIVLHKNSTFSGINLITNLFLKGGILSSVLFVFLFPSKLAWGNSDREKSELFGQVQSVHIIIRTLSKESGKWVEGVKTIERKQLYDKRGNIIQSAFYESDGSSLTVNYKLKYGESGNVLEKVSLNEVFEPISKNVHRYNKGGELLEEVLHETEEYNPVSKKLYVYESQGKKIEESSFDSNGELISKDVFLYDSNGNVREAINYGKSMDIRRHHWTYKYDSEGRKVEAIGTKGDGSFLGKHSYEYDRQGNLTKQVFFDDEGSVKSEEVFFYEFDKKGNWIKKTSQRMANGNGSGSVAYRKISYFP